MIIWKKDAKKYLNIDILPQLSNGPSTSWKPSLEPQRQTPGMKAVLKKYDSAKKFLLGCNPSAQLIACRDPEYCFFGVSPTLTELNLAYGPRTAEQWLVPQVTDVSLNCGLKEDASEEQIATVAVGIVSLCAWLKIGELLLFFFYFKCGKYLKFYSRFDTQIFMQSLRLFLDERAAKYDAHDRLLRAKRDEEDRGKAITYEQYLELKGKGSSP